jgi:hypothetical protein
MTGEFWAAIVGAIVGSISAGFITWSLQRNQDHRQTLERNQALARSLMFKLVRIHSDFVGFSRHVKECEDSAKRENLPVGWQSLRAIGNLPAAVSFSPEEMGYLLSLKNDDLFNDIISLDMVHASTIGIFELYKERRLALTDLMPAVMNGMVGTVTMTNAQKAAYDPKAAELDLLVSDIRRRVDLDVAESRAALEQANLAVAATLKHSLKLEFKEQ